MSYGSCPICGNSDAEVEGLGALDRSFAVECPTCGEYRLSDALKSRLEDDEEEYLPDRYVLSFLIREATTRDEALDVNTRNVTKLMQTARLPKNPTKKIDRMLAYMLTRSSHFGARIEFDEDCDYPVAGARDGEELRRLLAETVKDGLTEGPESEEDGYSLTLEEVGLYFNVTRERIRQIEAKALRRLRHPKRSRRLKDYLEH